LSTTFASTEAAWPATTPTTSSLLGYPAAVLATAGSDAAEYRDWLIARGVDCQGLRLLEGEITATGFTTTDMDDNQITAFHPGAMNFSHENDVRAADNVALGIVSPDGRDGMLQHMRGFAAAGGRRRGRVGRAGSGR